MNVQSAKIIKRILKDCRYEERNIDEACKMNAQLNKPVKKIKNMP